MHSNYFFIQFITFLLGIIAISNGQNGCSGCNLQQQQADLGCNPCQAGPGYGSGYQLGPAGQQYQGQLCNSPCAGGSNCQDGLCSCTPGYSPTTTDCVPANNGGPFMQALGYQPGLVPGYQPGPDVAPCTFQVIDCRTLWNGGGRINTDGGSVNNNSNGGQTTDQGQLPCTYQNGLGCGQAQGKTNMLERLIKATKDAKNRK